MNAHAQFLTITPEQLKHFEWAKGMIDSNLICTDEFISQMTTLFRLIAEESKKEKPSIDEIKNLANLGHYICEWSGLEEARKDLQKLSPFESTKA